MEEASAEYYCEYHVRLERSVFLIATWMQQISLVQMKVRSTKKISERGIRLRYSEQSGVTPVQEAIRRAKIYARLGFYKEPCWPQDKRWNGEGAVVQMRDLVM